MKNIIFVVIVCSSFLFVLTPSNIRANDLQSVCIDRLVADPAWKLTKESHGVSHYTRYIKECDINAYKGVFVLDRPVEVVHSFVSDAEKHPLWALYCTTSYTIEKKTEDNVTQYYNFDVPWPFLKRDIVVHCTRTKDMKKGTVTIDSNAINYPDVPLKKDHIRITEAKHRWIFEQIGPERTKVTFISVTNMEGQTPNVLKKLISHVIPSSSLENLKTISTKSTPSAPATYISKTDF